MRLNNLLEFVSNSNVIVKVIDEKSKIVKYEGAARGTLNKPEFNHFEVVSIDSCIEYIEDNSVAVIEIYTKNIYDELSNKLLEEQRKFVEKVKNATEEELKQNPRWNELRRLLDAE